MNGAFFGGARACVVGWVAVAACSHTSGGPSFGSLTDPPEPAELLAQLRQQSQGRSNLRATGRVEAMGPDGRVRLRTVLVAQRPASFRFETLTPFEAPISVMTSDGETIWLLQEGRLYEGPATPENVARLLPLPLRPEEIVETLLGGVPVSDRFEPQRLEEKDDRWRLHLVAPNGDRGRLLIDPESGRVLEAELRDANGALVTAVRFERFKSVEDGGPAIPTRIQVDSPQAGYEVRMRLTETETDVDLPAGLFVMQPPPGSSAHPFMTERR